MGNCRYIEVQLVRYWVLGHCFFLPLMLERRDLFVIVFPGRRRGGEWAGLGHVVGMVL